MESLKGFDQERVGLAELHPDVFSVPPRYVGGKPSMGAGENQEEGSGFWGGNPDLFTWVEIWAVRTSIPSSMGHRDAVFQKCCGFV